MYNRKLTCNKIMIKQNHTKFCIYMNSLNRQSYQKTKNISKNGSTIMLLIFILNNITKQRFQKKNCFIKYRNLSKKETLLITDSLFQTSC